MVRTNILRSIFPAALLFTSAGFAGMNFSVYVAPALNSDGTAVYNSVSVQDNSTGCGHSGYSTTATIYDPSGSQASSGGSGFSASASMPLNADGNFNFGGSVTYYCSCIQNTAGAGGGVASVPIFRVQAYYYSTGPIFSRCTKMCNVCDNLPFGTWSDWQYGLFSGAGINVGNTSWCAMKGIDKTTKCYYSQDPVPGPNNCGSIARFSRPTRGDVLAGPSTTSGIETQSLGGCHPTALKTDALRVILE